MDTRDLLNILQCPGYPIENYPVPNVPLVWSLRIPELADEESMLCAQHSIQGLAHSRSSVKLVE